MADYLPVYAGGQNPFSSTTSAAVTGGRVLIASGSGTVAHAGAGATTAVGVAAHDAASGARVTVWPLASIVHELSAPAAITAADGVITAANGEVATAAIATAAAAGTLIGIALTTAAGNKVQVIGRG
jgi:hypothetical protein